MLIVASWGHYGPCEMADPKADQVPRNLQIPDSVLVPAPNQLPIKQLQQHSSHFLVGIYTPITP